MPLSLISHFKKFLTFFIIINYCSVSLSKYFLFYFFDMRQALCAIFAIQNINLSSLSDSMLPSSCLFVHFFLKLKLCFHFHDERTRKRKEKNIKKQSSLEVIAIVKNDLFEQLLFLHTWWFDLNSFLIHKWSEQHHQLSSLKLAWKNFPKQKQLADSSSLSNTRLRI